jgi:hypothetical protein
MITQFIIAALVAATLSVKRVGQIIKNLFIACRAWAVQYVWKVSSTPPSAATPIDGGEENG